MNKINLPEITLHEAEVLLRAFNQHFLRAYEIAKGESEGFREVMAKAMNDSHALAYKFGEEIKANVDPKILPEVSRFVDDLVSQDGRWEIMLKETLPPK